MSDSLPAITHRLLGEIIDAKRGLTYSADQLVDTSEAGLAYYNMKSFRKDGGLNRDGVKRFSGIVPSEFILSEKDIIIANTDVTPGSDIIGSAVVTPAEHIGKATYSHHVTRLRVKDPLVRPRFLCRALLHEGVRRAMRAESRGTTVKMLDMQGALQIPITILPPDEQDFAVGIFDTLDTAICETEAIIAKLKAVKQGLLNDLLTRGVDVNGELRPPQAEAPHFYKLSPLGWIPKEWEEISLGEIASRSGGILQTGPFGSQLHAHEYLPDGVPVVMPQDMVNGELSQEHIARISERKAAALGRHRLQLNDLVFSRRGDLSRCVAIGDVQVGWICGTGCLLARFPRREVNGFWLAWLYPQMTVQTQVMGRAVGSTMANMNTSILAAIKVPKPDINEQNEIARRVSMVANRIAQESFELAKLRLEKSGLMDDLLTGRVRVTPLLYAEQQAQARSA